MKNIEYDIEELAKLTRKLRSKSRSIIITYGTLGVVTGWIAGMVLFGGSTPLTQISKIIGGLFGFSIGHTKAQSLKLLIQTALCQKQIEENTRK